MVKVRCIIIKDFYVKEVKFNSKLYPKSLQNIPNPPKKLYIQGIKQQILNIIKVTEEYLPQEEIDKINKEIQK